MFLKNMVYTINLSSISKICFYNKPFLVRLKKLFLKKHSDQIEELKFPISAESSQDFRYTVK
jgi:hypothetical protein